MKKVKVNLKIRDTLWCIFACIGLFVAVSMNFQSVAFILTDFRVNIDVNGNCSACASCFRSVALQVLKGEGVASKGEYFSGERCVKMH